MAGVKGRSGRKGGPQEKYRFETIEECWKLVKEAIANPNLDYKYRVELASRHTVKSMPTELSGDVGLQLTAMGTIVKDGDNLQFNIGSKPDEADVSDPPQDT